MLLGSEPQTERTPDCWMLNSQGSGCWQNHIYAFEKHCRCAYMRIFVLAICSLPPISPPAARLIGMRNRFGRSAPLCLLAFASCIAGMSLFAQKASDSDWPYYGGDAGGMRYSRLIQINPKNVSSLKVAWIFHTS